MKISSNRNYIRISFYKINLINLIKVKQLLEHMNIDCISVLLYDESNEYTFDNYILVNNFVDYISNIDSCLIIFDGYVEHCIEDREIDLLTNKKIFIDIDLGENMTEIIINEKNTVITKDEIKKIFSKKGIK